MNSDKTCDRDPDAFDMYIYNDFYAYAVLDLVDTTLTNLHTKVVKKDWNEAYCILEALTVFNESEGHWTQCDDGGRVRVTGKVYGALAVTVLRALKKEDRLDKASFPSLENLLRGIASVGEMISSRHEPDYAKVARGIARRLFKDTSDDDIALQKRQREEWFNGITDEEEKELAAEFMEDLAEEESTELWFMKGDVCDEARRNSDLSLTPVWKEYKAYLANTPRGPMRGPSFDINTWSTEEKRPFLFTDPSLFTD